MYLSDYHTHCSLSFDSKTPVEDMVRAGIAQGLQEMCLTDHVDLYRPREYTHWEHDFSARAETFARADQAADGKIIVRRGIELGESMRYLTLVLETAKWGKFSVLGHLTLPLRYMNENHGMHMSFDGFEDEVSQVFRALIENGCGIECNVNRGNTPLPDAKWLRLYHELGGEIITIGTDAHTPEFVGMRARETQELLKSCGLNYVCTFEKKKPVFHKI